MTTLSPEEIADEIANCEWLARVSLSAFEIGQLRNKIAQAIKAERIANRDSQIAISDDDIGKLIDRLYDLRLLRIPVIRDVRTESIKAIKEWALSKLKGER